METSFTLTSESAWPEAVRELLSYAGDKKKFLFSGEIGAGKTTFIQHICRALDVEDAVTSPTFALINEYEAPQQGTIYHLDLYRLKNIQEAIDIGIEDIIFGPAYCFIEWPDLILPMIDEDVVRIQIEIVEDSRRKILFL